MFVEYKYTFNIDNLWFCVQMLRTWSKLEQASLTSFVSTVFYSEDKNSCSKR